MSPRDGRGGPVTLGRAHPLLRHVDRVRGPRGGLRPYGPRPARRDGHVRRRLVVPAGRTGDGSIGRLRRLGDFLPGGAVVPAPLPIRPDRDPAELLAVFVVDTNETELTIPLGN